MYRRSGTEGVAGSAIVTTNPKFGEWVHVFGSVNRPPRNQGSDFYFLIPHTVDYTERVKQNEREQEFGRHSGEIWGQCGGQMGRKSLKIEPAMGLEPVTCGLRNRCSAD